MKTQPTTAFSLALALMLCGCKSKSQNNDTASELSLEARVESLLQQMSLDEKVAQMHGSGIDESGLWRTATNERLAIPGFAMSDGPRGVTSGFSTTFPVAMARAATWDPELEGRIARAIGAELHAKGGNVILAPAMNLLRHPGWGRAQETYGEDTHLMTKMSLAFVEGAQEWVIATPKHFAVNSIEDTRFDVDVTIDARTLHELYLPHFKAVVEADAGAVMSAYNSINGDYAAENKPLLTDILKRDWGFDGLVMSDWIWGTHDTVGAATAGLDIEMPSGQFYGQALVDAVQAGQVDVALIDDSARRILRTKLRFGLDSWVVGDSAIIESTAHVALAHEAALASMVLLKNEGALPLDDVDSLAVYGALADVANLGDVGSSNSTPSTASTPLDGIQAAAARAGATVVRTDDPTLANASDAAVVVVGLTSDDEGEQIPLLPGGDRDDLGLHAEDIALIEAVMAQQPRTIVVLEAGSALTVEPWGDTVPAIVMAWYPGMEGGAAVGELLFGEQNFSGRLPLSVPVALTDLPPFDHVSSAVTYDYWHGYRHLAHAGIAARFPFGHGLSYTSFSWDNLTVTEGATGPVAEVTVTNTGDRDGHEVVQVYLSGRAPIEMAERDLRGFAKVFAASGETVLVKIALDPSDLLSWQDGWAPVATSWTVYAGPNAETTPLQAPLP
jgi:beta-glucosidase